MRCRRKSQSSMLFDDEIVIFEPVVVLCVSVCLLHRIIACLDLHTSGLKNCASSILWAIGR